MYQLIGNKNEIAIELEVSTNKWSHKTALWLNKERIGNWDDENLLTPFILAIHTIATRSKKLWNDRLTGLNCREVFLTLNPFYIKPNSFYELTENEQEGYLWLDNFLLNWGENFNSWNINVICEEDNCRFIWLYNNNLKNRADNIDSLQCFNVPLVTIQNVYREMKNVIPDQFWPHSITNV